MSDAAKGMVAAAERRSAERLDVDLWVEQSSDRELYFQRSANISSGGIYLERTIPQPLGSVVALKFCFPSDPEPIRVRGEIVNAGADDSELGMGIKFLDLAERDRLRILSFVQQVTQKSTR